MASACKTAIPKKVLPLDGLLQMMQQELVKLGNVKCRKNASAHGKIKCARKFRYMFARVKVSKKPDIFFQWPQHPMILENYKKKSHFLSEKCFVLDYFWYCKSFRKSTSRERKKHEVEIGDKSGNSQRGFFLLQ